MPQRDQLWNNVPFILQKYQNDAVKYGSIISDEKMYVAAKELDQDELCRLNKIAIDYKQEWNVIDEFINNNDMCECLESSQLYHLGMFIAILKDIGRL